MRAAGGAGGGVVYLLRLRYGEPHLYGTLGAVGEVWYRVEEFYYDSRREGRQKTDSEYADALEALADGRPIREGGGRPSAASFSGVPAAAGLAGAAGGERGALRHPHHGGAAADGPAGHLSRCGDAIREFGLYRWDTSAGGRDQVCKEHDHAMDDIRYFAVTVAAKERGGSWAGSVERRIF